MADPRTWHAHITRDLDRLQAGLLDLIDCGLPQDDTDVRLREPTTEEVESTRRGEDEDGDYATPAGPSGRSHHIADPTGVETIRWADAVAGALADVDELLDAWRADTDRVTRQGGTTVPPTPAPLAVVEEPDGNVRATIKPARARRAAVSRIRWMTNAADAIVDHWEHETDPDLIAFWDNRTHTLRHQLRWAARRHGRHDRRDVRCDNPHGWKNHPVGDDPVDGICATCRDPSMRCDSCGEQLPEDHDKRNCWSCIGKAKRRRRRETAQSG